jgi:hypothetical protein
VSLHGRRIHNAATTHDEDLYLIRANWILANRHEEDVKIGAEQIAETKYTIVL